VSRVPVSWFESEHLRARLTAANVSQSDPAWCIATGHLWGPYSPDPMPFPRVSDLFAAVNKPEPIRAHRYCARCDAAQDYSTGTITPHQHGAGNGEKHGG